MKREQLTWPGDSPRQPGPAPRILAEEVIEYIEDAGVDVASSTEEVARALVPRWIANLRRRERQIDGGTIPEYEADEDLERRVLGDALRVAGLDADRVHNLLRGALKTKHARDDRYHFVDFVIDCCTSLSDVAIARGVWENVRRRPTRAELRAAAVARRAELAAFFARDLPAPTEDDLDALEVASRAVKEPTLLSAFREAYEEWCSERRLRPILSEGGYAKALSTALLACGDVAGKAAVGPDGTRERGFTRIGLLPRKPSVPRYAP